MCETIPEAVHELIFLSLMVMNLSIMAMLCVVIFNIRRILYYVEVL